MKISLKQIYRMVLFGTIVLLIFGCSKELSRDEAEKQIKSKFQLPRDEYSQFNFEEKKGERAFLIWTDPRWPGRKVGDTVGYTKKAFYPKSYLFSYLENEGLITIKEEQIQIDPHSSWLQREEYEFVDYYIASFTDKAKPYINGNSVKVITLDFGAITGIIERKEYNIAEVQYTERRKDVTPFGRAYKMSEETFNRSVTFTKYDDGWRIR